MPTTGSRICDVYVWGMRHNLRAWAEHCPVTLSYHEVLASSQLEYNDTTVYIETLIAQSCTVQPRLSEPLWPAPKSKGSDKQEVWIIKSIHSMEG